MTDEHNIPEEEKNTENPEMETQNSNENSENDAPVNEEQVDNVEEEETIELTFEGDEEGETKEEVAAEAENANNETAETAATENENADTTTSETPVEGAAAVAVPPKVKKPVSNKRWYSLRVISGKERKIKERIDLEILRSGWKETITQVLVPTEKVYKIRNGKKVISERNILPGYILVEAVNGQFKGEMITAIANIPNVIHFLGRTNPIPMQQSEANRMLGKVDDSQDVGEALIEPFIVGETVKIIDGPFSEFVGDIQEVNEEKKKLKVIVKIFGRGTEVELNFMQVEKQS